MLTRTVQPFNQILLLPTVLLTIRSWRELRRLTPITQMVVYGFCACAFLPWLLAVVAAAKPLDANQAWLLKLWSLPLAVGMALPFAAFGMLILLRRVVILQGCSAGSDSGPLKDTGLSRSGRFLTDPITSLTPRTRTAAPQEIALPRPTRYDPLHL